MISSFISFYLFKKTTLESIDKNYSITFRWSKIEEKKALIEMTSSTYY